MEEKQWLTTKEALRLLQITSRTTLNKYLIKFNIKVSKPMGRVYINHHDLLVVIEDNATPMGI